MQFEQIKNNPVFIGGHRKSGTTMLASLFDNHPDLFVYPGETAFFFKFFPIYDNPFYSENEKIDRIAKSVFQDLDEVVQDWLGLESCPEYSHTKAVEVFKQKLNKTSKTTKDYFEAVLSTAWELLPGRSGREKMWVEKTTSIEIYADTLFDWYPNAKFIHLLRDPRDNYGSIKSGWEKEYKLYFDSKERLLQSMMDRGKLGMEFAEINLKKFGPEKYLILRYEDVVSDTKKAAQKMAEFLGIEYSESMLKPSFGGKSWSGNNFENKSFDSVSKGNMSRWKERISEHEAKVLEYHFRPLLEKYGYALEYSLDEISKAAAEHYKWFNYAQVYSLKVQPPVNKQVLQMEK